MMTTRRSNISVMRDFLFPALRRSLPDRFSVRLVPRRPHPSSTDVLHFSILVSWNSSCQEEKEDEDKTGRRMGEYAITFPVDLEGGSFLCQSWWQSPSGSLVSFRQGIVIQHLCIESLLTHIFHIYLQYHVLHSLRRNMNRDSSHYKLCSESERWQWQGSYCYRRKWTTSPPSLRTLCVYQLSTLDRSILRSHLDPLFFFQGIRKERKYEKK